MALFDMFKPNQSQGNSNQGQGNQGQDSNQPNPQNQNSNQGGQQGTPTNGILQGMATPNSNQGKPENPLDAFKGIFDNTPSDSTNLPPSFSIPQEALTKVAGGLDFTKGVAQDLMAKAKTGDVESIIQLMQETSKQAYMTAMQHTSGLSNEFINTRLAHEQKGLGGLVRQELTTSALGQSTPQFSHPVVKEQLIKVAQGLQKQYPDASPEQIATMSKEYVQELANALNPNAGQSQSQQAGAETPTDWGKLFGA
jgi:hypothetical protein